MDNQTVINLLTYVALSVGGLLLAPLVWFLNRTVNQLDTLAKESQEQDRRLVSLEGWREMVGYRRSDKEHETSR